jgi:hypothetical protein
MLVATPALAALTVTVEQVGDSNEAVIKYSDANSANLPRAFALAISVDSGYVIKGIKDYKLDGEYQAGESLAYGIYPARIDIDDDNQSPTYGEVLDYGNPLADPCDPGSGGGNETDNIVVELGGLWVGDSNDPPVDGNLVTIKLSNGCDEDCNVTVTAEVTYRGGVVLEDGDDSTVVSDTAHIDMPGCQPACWSYDCFDCGDGNGDCFITFGDLSLIINAWPPLPYDPCADYNKDGFITFGDISVLINHWSPLEACPAAEGCSPCTPIP